MGRVVAANLRTAGVLLIALALLAATLFLMDWYFSATLYVPLASPTAPTSDDLWTAVEIAKGEPPCWDASLDTTLHPAPADSWAARVGEILCFETATDASSTDAVDSARACKSVEADSEVVHGIETARAAAVRIDDAGEMRLSVFRTLPAPPPGAQSGESDIDEARRLQLEYSAKTLGLRSTGIVLQRNVTTQGKQRTVRYGLALRHTGVRLGGGGVPKGIDGDYGVDAIFFEIAQNGTILPSSSGELPILRATRQFGYLNWRSCLLLRDEREVAERFAGFAGREYKARWRERFLSEREAGTAVRAIEIMLRSQLGERTRVSTRTQQVDFGLANEVYADRADCARRLLNDYRPINGRIGWARRWNGSDIYGCIQVATIFVGWVVVVALVWTLMMNIWTLRERTKMRKRRLARKKWVKWKGSYEVAFQNPAYGIWLMPTLGFAGTVIGMIEAIQGAGGVLAENIVDRRVAVQSISNNLATAFDTTFVGLLCSAIAYLLYTLILRHADYHAKK